MRRRLRAATATITLACALVVAGCQSEDPEPAPTAVLPTPEVPSVTPEPSPSPDGIQEDIDEAVTTYSEGRTLAEDMLLSRSTADVSESLSPYFADSYLAFWEAEFAEFREKSRVTDGSVQIDIRSATDYTKSPGNTELALLMCLDYSNVTTTEADGSVVDRGYDYTFDEIVMQQPTGQSWKAVDARSEFLPALEGSECEGSFG